MGILDSSQLIVFEVLFSTCHLVWALNSSSFFKYLASVLQTNISNFILSLTWNHWELKLFCSLSFANYNCATWDKLQRNHHNSLYLDSGCDWCCVSHIHTKVCLKTWWHHQILLNCKSGKSVRLSLPTFNLAKEALTQTSRNLLNCLQNLETGVIVSFNH